MNCAFNLIDKEKQKKKNNHIEKELFKSEEENLLNKNSTIKIRKNSLV